VGVKTGFENSKKYGAKVKLYYGEFGDITYYVTFKVNGKKSLKPVGKKSNGWTEKRAFDQRAKLIDKAKFGTGVHSEMVTVGELAVEYFEWAEIHNRSWEKTQQKFNKHLSYLDNRVVMSLKDRDITKLQKTLKDKALSNSYNNDVMGILTAVVNFGVREGAIEYSPFRNIKKLKEKDAKDRFLTQEEIDKILFEVKSNLPFYNFVLIALNTGLRAEAVLRTRKIDIDFKDGFFNVGDTKRDQRYRLPLSPVLYDYFHDYESPYLVGGDTFISYNTFYTRFKKILDKVFNVGLDKYHRDKVTMHTFRHTFASHMTRLGMNSLTLQKYLNHADGKMTAKYAHLNDDSGRNYFSKLYSESE
jgi:integrase